MALQASGYTLLPQIGPCWGGFKILASTGLVRHVQYMYWMCLFFTLNKLLKKKDWPAFSAASSVQCTNIMPLVVAYHLLQILTRSRFFLRFSPRVFKICTVFTSLCAVHLPFHVQYKADEASMACLASRYKNFDEPKGFKIPGSTRSASAPDL